MHKRSAVTWKENWCEHQKRGRVKMDQSTSRRDDFFTGAEVLNFAAGHSRPSPAELGVEGGSLHKLLRSMEYNLFPQSAVFESDFIQVSRRGNLVDIYNIPTLLTLGVTSSVPLLPLPNILIIASRDNESKRTEGEGGFMKITRLLPMKLVRLSIHKNVCRCLKLTLANHSTYYLQLQDKHPHQVFKLWEVLICILHVGLSTTFKDPKVNLPKTSLCDSRSSSTSTISSQKSCRNIPNGSNNTSHSKIGVWKRSNQVLTLHIPPKPMASERPKSEEERGGGGRKGGETNTFQSEDEDRTYFGLWERDRPTLMPLSRLSSLIAVGLR